MKIRSIANEDLKLLKAVKPFMSNSSQEMIDMTVNILKIFKPEEPGQKINLDALTSFLSVVNESFEAEKAAILEQNEEQTVDVSGELENIENEKNTDENIDENNEEIDEEENGNSNNDYEIDDDFERNDDNNQQSKAKDVENLLNLLSNKKDKNDTN